MDRSLRQSVVIALLVAGALFMEQLDGTVIATGLPQMAQSFGVAAVDLNIGMSAYLPTNGVFAAHSAGSLDEMLHQTSRVRGRGIAEVFFLHLLASAIGLSRRATS